MITVHLTEDKCWKGVIYESGEREIPEDLAEILGLMPQPQPEPKDVRKSIPKSLKSEGESGGN
jgi:hypothetical protein